MPKRIPRRIRAVMFAAEDYGNTTQNPDATDAERIAAFNKVRRETYHAIQQTERRYHAVLRDLLACIDGANMNAAFPVDGPRTSEFWRVYLVADELLAGAKQDGGL